MGLQIDFGFVEMNIDRGKKCFFQDGIQINIVPKDFFGLKMLIMVKRLVEKEQSVITEEVQNLYRRFT